MPHHSSKSKDKNSDIKYYINNLQLREYIESLIKMTADES